jgi:hypothetical protein
MTIIPHYFIRKLSNIPILLQTIDIESTNVTLEAVLVPTKLKAAMDVSS